MKVWHKLQSVFFLDVHVKHEPFDDAYITSNNGKYMNPGRHEYEAGVLTTQL
jgi:hypothetical protein